MTTSTTPVGRHVAVPLHCETVDDPRRADALAAEWDELADLVGAGPLARPAYALSWWRHLGRGRLLVAVVRDQGRLVALAPLHERRVGPVTVVRWLGHGLGTVAEALVRPGHEAAATVLWSGVATRRRVLDLVEARADSAALAALTDLDLPGRRTTVTARDRCPVIDLEDDGLAHLRRPGSKNLRKVLSKADRALAEAGHVHRVEVAVDPARFEQLLPDVRVVFDAAEAARPRQHLLAPPYDAFVLDYLRGEVAAGRGAALVGYLDERPITFLLAMTTPSSATLSLWISRYAPGSETFSPGHLLLRETFRWAAGAGLRRVDQLLGESQTKRQWSSGSYETVEVGVGSRFATGVVSTATTAAARLGDLRARGGPR